MLIWNYTGNAQRERRFNLSNVWKENVNKILSPQSESWNNNFWITIDLKKAMVNHLDEISWIFFIVNRTKTLSMFRIMRTSHEKKVWKFCINWYGYNNFTPHLLKKLMIFLIKSVLTIVINLSLERLANLWKTINQKDWDPKLVKAN